MTEKHEDLFDKFEKLKTWVKRIQKNVEGLIDDISTRVNQKPNYTPDSENNTP